MIKAIRFEKTGGPEVLEYKDYDLPAPGPARYGSGTPPSA